MLKLKNINILPERFFLVAGFVLGLIMIFITPPFQAPDEPNHFFPAWQISQGQFTGVKENNRVGGLLPVTVHRLAEKFVRQKRNFNIKTSREEILAGREISLYTDSIAFYDFPNSAIYTPVSYVPQAVAIRVLRWFDCKPFYIFYATRIVTLLVWLLVIYFAIRQLPGFKWLFTVLALLPMSLFANMAMSADMVTNAIAFYTLSYVLAVAFSDEQFGRRKMWTMIVLAFLLASAKLVYAPLLLLLLLIPGARFTDKRDRFLKIAGIFCVAALTVAGWSVLMGKLYTPHAAYNPDFRNGLDLMPGSDAREQVNYILTHDTYILRVFLTSLHESSEMYVPGYVGTFGWLDTFLPAWLVVITYVSLFFIALFGDKSKILLNRKQLALTATTFVILLFAVIISQLLSWEWVGSQRVLTLQGRYFIPVFPLFFLLLTANKWSFTKVTRWFAVALPLIAGCVSFTSIYNRYYVDPIQESTIIQCGAEEVYHYEFFSTNIENVYLEGGSSRSEDVVRTGKYSFLLLPELSYAGACRMYNLREGDSLLVEAWCYNDSAKIVLGGTDFYPVSSVDTGITEGWHKISLGARFDHDRTGKETAVFLMSVSATPVYFDDLEIRVIKNEAELK